MKVAVVGGKLQGVEAVYLSQKAGWDVVLVDKDKAVPALGLCNSFCHLDVTQQDDTVRLLKNIDLVIPALENRDALHSLAICAQNAEVPIIYDPAAYSISSSKLASNQLFARLGIPVPTPWPGCGYPVLVKPSGASGSKGVRKISGPEGFKNFISSEGTYSNWVLEEFLEGPSFSIEVIGYAGRFKVLEITELQMDDIYDCKRVIAPAALEPRLVEKFEKIALDIAANINLNGIMDVETILHDGELKVLEIDARLPSQTPTAVFQSTGVNMLEVLAKAFIGEKHWDNFDLPCGKGVILEHLKVTPDRLEICGEHIMAGAGCLNLYRNFLGADEVITDYRPGKTSWVATLIIMGLNQNEAWKKRCQAILHIMETLGVCKYSDPFPVCSDEIDFVGSL